MWFVTANVAGMKDIRARTVEVAADEVKAVPDEKHECRFMIEELTREIMMLERSNTILRLELCDPDNAEDVDYKQALEENDAVLARKRLHLIELENILAQLDPAFRAERSQQHPLPAAVAEPLPTPPRNNLSRQPTTRALDFTSNLSPVGSTLSAQASVTYHPTKAHPQNLSLPR